MDNVIPPNTAEALSATLINLEGFQTEIAHALDELDRMLAEGDSADDVVSRLATLLDEDLRPCLAFAARAAMKLHEQLETLDASDACATDRPST